MIDEREIVRRAVEQLAPPEPSFARLSQRRDRKQRNRRIGGAVVALVVVGATVAGLLGALSSDTTVPGDPRTPFLGAWESTDAEGDTQTMSVRVEGNVAIAITMRDDAASACSGAPSTITGTGRLAGSERFVIPSPVFTCDDGSDPAVQAPPLEEQLHNLTFVLDAGAGTLTDSLGSVWKRPKGNPVPDPSAADLGIFAGVRGWIAYHYREPGIWAMDPANPDTEPVLLDPGAGVPVAWSRDGSKLLILRGHGELLVLNADGTETHVADGASGYPGGSFTPDGSQVVYASGHGISSVDAEGGAPHLIYRGDGVYQPALSPDGSRLAWFEGHGDAANSLWVMNVDGTGRRRILGEAEAGRTPWSLQWSPDGTRLALSRGGADRSLLVVNADGSGSALHGPKVSEVLSAGPFWSPDGTLLAFATGDSSSPSFVIARPDGTDLRELGVGQPGPWNPLDPAATTTTTPTTTDGPPPSTAPTAFRGAGEFIGFAPSTTGAGWDLAAQDPRTGDVRTIVETDGLVDCAEDAPCTNFIRKAEWSADGRWIAFQVSNESLDGPPLGPCGRMVGIWVVDPNGVARQLTTPCDAPPSRSDEAVQELWEWSPVGDRIVYARIDGETDELFVIDPSDDTRTSLVTVNIDPPYPAHFSSLAWSPDGSRIAYVDGSSVFAVDVEGGEPSLLADSFEEIIDMAWSPDGTQILVHDQGRYRIQVMNADGSDLHVLLQGKDACCQTAWSPNGERIVYMLSVRRSQGAGSGSWESEVWTVAPDGSNRVKVFDGGACRAGSFDSLPAWSPDGSQVAYRGCGGWVAENADGTGDRQPIDELVWRSWSSGGLTEADLAGIGQRDH